MTFLKGALLALLVVAGAVVATAAGPGPKGQGGARVAAHGVPARATLPPGSLQARAVTPAAAQPLLPDTWSNLFADDFEGTFPGSWQVINNGTFNGAGWGRWTCWYGSTPGRSVGSAAGGASAIACDGPYYANMNGWLVYGPFSLANGYTAAELQFRFKLESEEPAPDIYDYFSAMASANGSNFFGVTFAGAEAPQQYTLDLANVPGLGTLIGDGEVWIAFLFHSDESVQAANGAQVDDVVVRVGSAAANQAPQVTVTSPNGGESWAAGATHNITWTASDPDGGPNPLSVAIDWSNDSGGTWQAVATGLASTGTYAWVVPAGAIATARVRLRASDGAAEGQDTSDANFTITEVQPGNNTLTVGSGAGASGTSISLPLALVNEVPVKGLQFDLVYNAAVASFTGASLTSRGVGMTISSNVVSDGRARVVIYHDDNSVIAAGSGDIAELTFEVTGQPTQTTTVAPADIILSDANAQQLTVAGEQGTITVQAATEAPDLQIAVLKNPGRVRTMQILVNVTRGSGNSPTVTAGGIAVTMTALGGSRYIGTCAVANGAASVTVMASDTNAQGLGSNQTTVTF